MKKSRIAGKKMEQQNNAIAREFLKLVEIMRLLRSPEGCSWDRKQTHESLADNVIEEAREVVEAIHGKDDLHIREELGDLLMMVVFHAQIAAEAGKFDMSDVARGICEKLVFRHPHVFTEEGRGASPDRVSEMWGEIKKKEKLEKSKISNRMVQSLGFPSALSAAEKVQKEAATVGFDFPDAAAAVYKIAEEAEEIKGAVKAGNIKDLEEEIGDLLFAVLNVSRLSGVDAETCLRRSTEKFVKRFTRIETLVEQDGGFEGKSLEELDKYWDKIKLEK